MSSEMWKPEVLRDQDAIRLNKLQFQKRINGTSYVTIVRQQEWLENENTAR